jgi:hypothetical protein
VDRGLAIVRLGAVVVRLLGTHPKLAAGQLDPVLRAGPVEARVASQGQGGGDAIGERDAGGLLRLEDGQGGVENLAVARVGRAVAERRQVAHQGTEQTGGAGLVGTAGLRAEGVHLVQPL